MTLSKIVIITAALSAQMVSGDSWSDTPENKDNQEAAGNRYQNTSLMAKTAKQRLGKKWSDDQRINNCKVPIQFRGSKSRPDKCYVTGTN
jgi:phospholipase/lecithinase/hemolysin